MPGNVLFIPRIPLSLRVAGLPFTLRLRQFPVGLRRAFAMQCVRELLDEPMFSHGQLQAYVAASRCGDPQNIRLCVDSRQTANVVYPFMQKYWPATADFRSVGLSAILYIVHWLYALTYLE